MERRELKHQIISLPTSLSFFISLGWIQIRLGFTWGYITLDRSSTFSNVQTQSIVNSTPRRADRKAIRTITEQEAQVPVQQQPRSTQVFRRTSEEPPLSSQAKTCKPALGHSFAAGTTDGGGDLNFTQGATEGDPFWDGIRDSLLGAPSNETQDCHRPKPILFNTGEMNWPLPWHPQIVDVQMLTIGPLAIVAIPGEMTTMSGRRIREAVKQELQSQGSFKDAEVVLAGLSNIYTHYITTYEEYQIQRYEGASTIFGPHTLSAYVQKFRGLARAIAEGKEDNLPVGPEPPFFTGSPLFNLLPAAGVDRKPVNTSFGDVLEQVNPFYTLGDIVSVTFVAGNPRHSGDIRDKTFITVEKFHNKTSSWEVIHTDASWETRFYWLKGENQHSNTTVEWHIPRSAQTGSYRIRHFGHFKERKGLTTIITPYEGISDMFSVSQKTWWYV